MDSIGESVISCSIIPLAPNFAAASLSLLTTTSVFAPAENVQEYLLDASMIAISWYALAGRSRQTCTWSARIGARVLPTSTCEVTPAPRDNAAATTPTRIDVPQGSPNIPDRAQP